MRATTITALIEYIESRGHAKARDEYDEDCKFGEVVQSGPMEGNKRHCTCGKNDLIKALEAELNWAEQGVQS